MSELLSKGYEFAGIEEKWLKRWNEAKGFQATMEEGRPSFSIVIPPPNVTGVLHVGHALNNTMQDVLIRYHRMCGDNTVWVPGTDHAGIATQNVVERQLAAEGKSRHDLGRDEFVRKVWEWRAEKGGTIIRQLKRLGASCDWDRERFTMDEGLSSAVREVFVRLYHEGLIYKGDYIVNWCPRCHTALADDEVEHEEKNGKLYHIRYPFADGSGFVVVATTRPETMLGDTAVAVHPEDERYAHLAGVGIRLPLSERIIPIVFDHHVQKDFGTGALGDMACHTVNMPFRALKLGYPTVVECEMASRIYSESYPLTSRIRFEFPERDGLPPLKFWWYDGAPKADFKPLRPYPNVVKDVVAINGSMPESGCLIIGDKGALFAADDYGAMFFLQLEGEEKFVQGSKHEAIASIPESIPRSPGHYKEWIEMIKGGPAAYSNFEIAGYLTEIILLGCIALRVGEGVKMEWDGPNMRSPNCPEAERFVKRNARTGW